MNDQKALPEAAKEFYSLLIKTYTQPGGGVHVGTLVSAAGRMAGSSLLRSFAFFPNQHVEPGTVLLSEEANVEGNKLMVKLVALLKVNGVELDQAKVVFKAPPQHAPKVELLEMQKDLQVPFYAIAKQHGLDYAQAAQVGVMTCVLAILQCRKVIDPHITTGIAIYSLVEGCKTAPFPLPANAGQEG